MSNQSVGKIAAFIIMHGFQKGGGGGSSAQVYTVSLCLMQPVNE